MFNAAQSQIRRVDQTRQSPCHHDAINIELLEVSAKYAVKGLQNEFVRAIAVIWNPKVRSLVLRYYLLRQPTDDDREACSSTLAEIEADFWLEIVTSKDECIYTNEPPENLDSLAFFVYMQNPAI